MSRWIKVRVVVLVLKVARIQRQEKETGISCTNQNVKIEKQKLQSYQQTAASENSHSELVKVLTLEKIKTVSSWREKKLEIRNR